MARTTATLKRMGRSFVMLRFPGKREDGHEATGMAVPGDGQRVHVLINSFAQQICIDATPECHRRDWTQTPLDQTPFGYRVVLTPPIGADPRRSQRQKLKLALIPLRPLCVG